MRRTIKRYGIALALLAVLIAVVAPRIEQMRRHRQGDEPSQGSHLRAESEAYLFTLVMVFFDPRSKEQKDVS